MMLMLMMMLMMRIFLGRLDCDYEHPLRTTAGTLRKYWRPCGQRIGEIAVVMAQTMLILTTRTTMTTKACDRI
jgi:hypothetical protein